MTIRPRFSWTVLKIVPIFRINFVADFVPLLAPCLILQHGDFFDFVSDFSEEEMSTVIGMEQLTRKMSVRCIRTIL